MNPVQIGDATLYLGDCRDVCADIKADMIFTDPPYGHNNNNNGDLIARWEAALGKTPVPEEEWRPIANDGREQAAELAEWIFSTAPDILAQGGCCCCCCCGGGPDPQFARWALMMDGPLNFKQMIIWDKGPMGMGWHYRRSYETVLVGQKRGGACKWYDESGAIENIIRPGYRGIKKIIPLAEHHPTPKPPELARHFIRLHTLPGEVILDPFMGGGSTAVAAIMEGRKFIGVELEERWFDVACEQIQKAYDQPDLFVEQPRTRPAEQLDMMPNEEAKPFETNK